MSSTQKILVFDDSEQEEPRHPTWLKRLRGKDGVDTTLSAGNAPETATLQVSDDTDQEATGYANLDVSDFDGSVEQLRKEALARARSDAERNEPSVDTSRMASSEVELRERCRALYERWRTQERDALEERWAEQEKSLTQKIGRASLLVDRIQRVTHELQRLKARLSMRRQEVVNELERSVEDGGGRNLSTKSYLAAVSFLAVVEYFANAPVFGSLLPRDPLTERQIRVLSEVSEGWLAGAQRVFAQLALRPDAALLAAGVVTFLCVLGHFFGRSLRDMVTHGEQQLRRDTVTGRSRLEHGIPLLLTGVGLALVIGVLFEARVTLGEVGEQRYQDDMAVVEELRREAGWMRVDGDLTGANERADRADDMDAAATELREYSISMSRLSFPILLLNLTLILCAICAAYYHRRVTRWEYFDDTKFEDDRRGFLEAVEEASEDVARLLGEGAKHVRELKGLLATRSEKYVSQVATRLESVVTLYRTENARVRSLDVHDIGPFNGGVALDLDIAAALDGTQALHSPEEYEADLNALRGRFSVIRNEFNQESIG